MSGFVAPYSPPAESSMSSKRPAGQVAMGGGGQKKNDCPRTLPRKNTLRETKTESSLPTPPRTRDVRLGSCSPVHRSASPPNSRRQPRPTFAYQLDAPMEEGGLIPPAILEENIASSSFNPFLVSTSSSSSSNPFASSSSSHHSPPSDLLDGADNAAGGSAFSPLPPPAPPARPHRSRNHNSSHAHTSRKHLDALGPSRRGALKGSTMPIASENSTTPMVGGPIWEEGNPFLEGMGLVGKGLVGGGRKERVGEVKEKETMGYVFRGVKTLFANPYYSDPSHAPHLSTSLNAQRASKPIDHPEYSPPSNPPPRLLFPAASAESDEDDDAPEPLKPRLLFASTPKRTNKAGEAAEKKASPKRMMVDEDVDELEDEEKEGGAMLTSGKRAIEEVMTDGDREEEDEREWKRMRE